MTQQSGGGGNPERGAPQEKKSVGGAEQGKGPATTNPGRDYEGGRYHQRNEEQGDGQNPDRNQQGANPQRQPGANPQRSGQQPQSGQPQSGQRPGEQQREQQRKESGTGQSAGQQTGGKEQQSGGKPQSGGQQQAGGQQQSGGQQRRDTGTPGSSDQSTPEKGVMYDENKSAK
jgi:hypothetical protein